MNPVEIEQLMKDHELEKFCDTKFPPTFASIYGDHTAGGPVTCSVTWMRPHEIYNSDDYKIFGDKIEYATIR